MREEIAVTLDNLADSDGRSERERRRRTGHLSELAHALICAAHEAEEAESPRALLSAVPELLREGSGEVLTPTDRAELTLCLLREAERLLGYPVTASALAGGPCPPAERARTVYVRNPLTEEAYARLASCLAAPTVGYRQNFRELFDDVENGYADYAVLPLLSGGRTVGSVTDLLEERGLFITATATVPTGEDEVVFALLAREPFALSPPRCFSLRAELADGEALAGLLAAASRFSLSLLRLDSAPAPYGDRMACHILLGGEDFTAMLAYLSLFVPSFTGYGFYSEL